MNVVTEIIETIRQAASVHGLTLHRYQANKKAHATTITYVLHSSADRPKFSRDCDGPSAVLTKHEGTTERCEAFRELSQLLASIPQNKQKS
ncbi:MAG TPA: hypothetical protein DIW64_18875 [Cellvibrio sp.]|nr:hypothetical protein [Cellvibrio sp.]